jgi:hypothetical protein
VSNDVVGEVKCLAFVCHVEMFHRRQFHSNFSRNGDITSLFFNAKTLFFSHILHSSYWGTAAK